MSQSKSLARIFKYILANWNLIGLLGGFFGAAILSVLSGFIPALQSNPQIIGTFIYLAGGSLIFVLIEIRHELRREQDEAFEGDFFTARPRMLNEITRESHRTRETPLVIRIVGMRLMGIRQFLADLAHVAKEHRFGRRKIIIKIFHVDPKYYSEQEPRLRADTDPPPKRIRQQTAVLIANIAEIKAMFALMPNISIEFASYKNIPLFWGVEIDARILFWGFFTWDRQDQNWIGPENTCFVFHANTPSHKPILDGLQNRIESLEDWALSTIQKV